MSVTATNLILGPATLYYGLFGSAEPLDTQVNTTPAASAWTDAGGTLGGVKLTINQTYTVLNVDQVVDVVGRRLTSRDIQVVTQLAEPTLQNMQLALNGGTLVTGSGAAPTTYDPATALSASQPLYNALMIDGWGPSQFRRRIIVRKVLSMASTDLNYAEAVQAAYPVTWGAHYVSAAITPFHVVDANQ
jgi:hypothetical protein